MRIAKELDDNTKLLATAAFMVRGSNPFYCRLMLTPAW